jgi:hypothetical protein
MDRETVILGMIAAQCGASPEKINHADVFGSTGMAGDDADEFMLAFAEKYGVDLADFRAYLHYNGNEPPVFETSWGGWSRQTQDP